MVNQDKKESDKATKVKSLAPIPIIARGDAITVRQ